MTEDAAFKASGNPQPARVERDKSVYDDLATIRGVGYRCPSCQKCAVGDNRRHTTH